jgi:hypothetical protein
LATYIKVKGINLMEGIKSFPKVPGTFGQLFEKEGYRQVLENTKEIHNTITTLNQQNREYYSLRFAEVQKELTGIKVELGKIK